MHRTLGLIPSTAKENEMKQIEAEDNGAGGITLDHFKIPKKQQ